MADTLRKMKIIIVVLSILLGLSLAALAGVIIYGQLDRSTDSAVIPDNYIETTAGRELNKGSSTMQFRTMPVMLCASVPNINFSRGVSMMALSKTVITSDSAKGTVISIYKTHAEDSTPFHSANMFPGDSETKAYLVEVSHKGTVTVRFHADIRAGYEKLAEVLKCKVVLRGENKLLYNGLMRDMPDSINHRITSVFRKTTDLTYDITVYLDTSVGNEYMNKELVADFRWWVEESGGGSTPPTPGPDDIPEEYRVMNFEDEEPELTMDDKMDMATDLAFDLDEFFRQHDPQYAAQHPEPHEQKELIADLLLEGKTAALREMLEEMAQTGDDVLPGRIAEYERETGYDPKQDTSITEDKAKLIERPEQPDDHLTGERIQTPRGSFALTDLSKEQMEVAGYGVHHQSDDRQFLIMGNGTRAFAVVNAEMQEKENPLKTAEMTVEDDYAMIDGQINNGKREETKERPSIRERLAEAKRECAERPTPEKAREGRGTPEHGSL